METGRYFFLDKKSNFEKKALTFRYLNIESANSEAKYPVFVNFDNNKINFFYHGNTSNKNYIISELFTLNLINNKIEDKLTDQIKDIYDDISSNLDIINKINLESDLSKSLYINSFNGYETGLEEKNTIYFRQIFLDFIYDFYNSGIFKLSPLYNIVKDKLNENILLQAILKKCKYSLYSEKIEKENNYSFKLYYSKIDGDKLKFKKEWLEFLTNKDFGKCVNTENKWFKDIEEEVKTINYNNLDENTLKSISKWQLSRYNIFEGFSSFFGEKKIRFIFSFIFAFLFLGALVSGYFFSSRFANDDIVTTNTDSLTIVSFINNNDTLYNNSLLKFEQNINEASKKENKHGLLIDATLAILLILIFVFLSRKEILTNFLSLTLPKLNFSLLACWIGFYSFKGQYDFASDENINYFSIILIIPLFLYIQHQLKFFADDLEGKRIFIRTSLLIIYTFFLSFSFGLFLMPFFKYIEFDTLLSGTIFSLYVGVFLEFIIKEKSITDTLY